MVQDILYLFASITQNWLKEFMTGMEKNLAEPEGKKMLKVKRKHNGKY